MKRSSGRLSSGYVAALLCLAAPSVRASQDMPAGDVVAGREYAVRTCSDCHRVIPATNELVTVLRTMDFEMIANTKGMNAITLNAFLSTPHPKMPNLIIPREDKANVIAYILSLRLR